MKRQEKINALLGKTQHALGYPPHVIVDVVNHQFTFLRNFLMYPTSAGIRYKYLGVFRPRSLKAVSLYISALIKVYRKYKDETHLERIRHY